MGLSLPPSPVRPFEYLVSTVPDADSLVPRLLLATRAKCALFFVWLCQPLFTCYVTSHFWLSIAAHWLVFLSFNIQCPDLLCVLRMIVVDKEDFCFVSSLVPLFIKHSHLKCHPPLPPPIHLLIVCTFASLWLESAQISMPYVIFAMLTVSLSFGTAQVHWNEHGSSAGQREPRVGGD